MRDGADADAGQVRAQRTVIRRKITVPDLEGRLVERHRLDAMFASRLIQHRAVVVCASAGAGKTTAAVQALRRLGRPIAWVSLDETDQAAGRLLVYLEAAVETLAPDSALVATDALASSIPLAEAAGLLAESLGGTAVILVCDNAERVVASAASLSALSAMARYLPRDANLVLISRVDVALDTDADAGAGVIGRIGESDLAFTVDEARAALELIEHPEVDAGEAVRLTGGWATGVLFGSWSQAASVDEPARHSRLHEYLSAHILGGLRPDERRFLIRTSLLDDVGEAEAIALDEPAAAAMLIALRTRHLPVVWSADGRRMRAHPQFREYLNELLAREDGSSLADLHRRHAALLLERGQIEEAVDVLLRLGDTRAAWRHATEVLPHLIARMDFLPAARWLDQLGPPIAAPAPPVAAAVLRVSFALEQCTRGVALFDAAPEPWLAGPASGYSAEATVLLAWCLWHAGRLDDAVRVADGLAAGWERDVVTSLLALGRDATPEPLPAFATTPSGPLDGMLMRLAYTRGRLDGLGEPGSHGPWRTVLGAPWVVAARRVTGRIEQAMALYESHRDEARPLWLHAIDAVELMLDLGQADSAWQAMAHGRSLISESGSVVYRVLNLLVEAKMRLRLDRDWVSADRVLAEAAALGVEDYAFTSELSRMWIGLSLLHQGRNDEARGVLSSAVQSMQRGDRLLELSTAATYLAEACWRLGAEDESDAAAALALTTATDQGTRHLLLQALADVPAVAVRSADAEPRRSSSWHELNALLAAPQPVRVAGRAPRLVFEEFGEPAVSADGHPVRPRLTKSLELLAFLIAAPDREATREASRSELLDALFDGRNDAAGRSYLRQALYRLREVLPPDLAPVQSGDRFRIPGPDLVAGSGDNLLRALSQADRQDGDQRLATLTGALTRATRGRYLATMSSPWVDARREDIEQRVTTARLDAARLSMQAGDYRAAQDQVDRVLVQDPYREQAWRLSLSLAHASGNDDAVLARFQRYVAVMRELGVPPSAEVRRLVTQLRR